MADFPITLASTNKQVLTDIERIGDFSILFSIPFTVLSAVTTATGSTDTVTITLGALPTWFLIDRIRADVATAFTGTGGLTVQVGTSTTTNALLTAGSVLTKALLQPSTGMNTVQTIASGTGTAGGTLVAVFTNSTSGSPSAVTAGQVNIRVNLRDLTS